MTDKRLSNLLNLKEMKIRQHLGSLQSPCIWSKFEILVVFERFSNFLLVRCLAEAVKASNLYVQGSKLGI